MAEIKCSYKELVPIHKIQPHPKNPHVHSPEQIEKLSKLIDFQGVRHPIIISKRSGFVVAGHGRLEAFKKLNLAHVPVDYQDFENEAQEYAFVVSDNAIGKDEWAALDLSEIRLELKNIDLQNIEMLGIKNIFINLDQENNDLMENVENQKNEGFSNKCPECGFQF